ncbi:MAG: GNAT family N-acetyltransferase [Oscillospiraceae bacterium]|jgi:ribosomal protein S18 acetylase RimI-like enzyme|nr:GNAT family N-acetyltransferase [Oscillospiraceae bacterium]
MTITDFTADYIEQATALVQQNHEQERGFCPFLPANNNLPDMKQFADNQLGVAAIENGEMVGFLCSYPPIQRPFQLENVLGAYSPKCANAAVGSNRAVVYAQMYQAVADKWARAGLSNHAITLYAHDDEVKRQFFEYGFGLWGMNAMRPMEEIDAQAVIGVDCIELPRERFSETLPLQNALTEHFLQSPMFIRFERDTEEDLAAECAKLPFRYFAAFDGGKMIAYMRVLKDMGNTGRQTICGAYLLPEYRGRGIYQALLNHVIAVLKAEGNFLLEVDFESFNPTARGFWMKYFTLYMCGVVRRIDEKAVMV